MPDKTYAKFILNNETYLDLTSDTVDSSSLLSGYTAHDRSGASITGSFDPSVFVLKAGDTMTGPLILSGAPTENLHAATKKYVDDNVGVVTQENGTSSNNFRILLSTSTTDSTETGKAHKSKGLNYTPSAGYLILDRVHSSTTAQTATLAIGNSTTNGTAGATYGEIRLYSPSQYSYIITSASNAAVLSGNKSIYLPYGVTSGRYLAVTTNSDGDSRRVLAQESTSGTYSVLLANGHSTVDLTSYANKNVGFYYEIASSVLKIYRDHSNTATQSATIELGNNTNDGVSGSSYGSLRIFGKNTYYTEIYDKNSILTANRELYLPNKSGTIAITDDLNSYLPLTGGTLTGNLAISSTDASAGASALGALVLGNSTPTSESGSSYGRIMMYSESEYYCKIDVYGVLTDYRSLYLPDKNGTLAVTSDLNSYVLKSGDSMTGALSFYDGSTLKSKISNTELQINGHNMLKMSKMSSQAFSTSIANNANLNSSDYTSPGMYYHWDGSVVASFSNCPTNQPFSMWVEAPINNSEDNTGTYKYRIRHIIDVNNNEYSQYCAIGGTANSWTYGVWKHVDKEEWGTTTVSGVQWTWVKHTSGIAEMWADITLKGTWIAWGNMYVLSGITNYTLPIALSNKFEDITTYLCADSSYSSAFPIRYNTITYANRNTVTTCDLGRPSAGENNVNYYCRKYIKGLI